MNQISKFKKIIRNQRGSTLVELLVYMALLSIFLLVLTDIFVSILEIRTESEATSNVEQDGRFILARLFYDVSRASAVTNPSSLGGSSNSLQLVIGGVTYSYGLNGTNLQLTDNQGIDNLNSSESKITSASFQKIGNVAGKETIKILFTVESLTVRAGGSEVRTFQTTVGRR